MTAKERYGAAVEAMRLLREVYNDLPVEDELRTELFVAQAGAERIAEALMDRAYPREG